MAGASYACYSAPTRGAEYCDYHVCLCVCLSASISPEYLPDFFVHATFVVAESSSGGVTIRHTCAEPRQLNVAAQLIEAQPTCSLGCGYKWHVFVCQFTGLLFGRRSLCT